ncbi:F0F1 ATP synthase subunit delta [Fructilactobacillus fructivorans]|uniref:ATP synthase F1 subunit delta n=1 Tax=Fructilactobacillus fructivorans TaxID=1614 RepID=UPI00070502E0|nr:ATP synthase F1 subunit delta [Fructilactobacillus fructivorans]KRN12640.1 F0F1 ATP synthase subunit delta [Fructilactobacillus fructivorans]
MSLDKVTLAKRYSNALFQVLEEHNELETGNAELMAIKAVFQNDPSLSMALAGPVLDLKQKDSIINSLIDGSTSEYVKNFVKMVYDYGRINDMVAIIDEFGKLYDKKQGIVRASVVTAVSMNDEEKDKLTQTFAQRVGAKTVDLSAKVDSSIIGGAILSSDNVVYDGSVRTKIKEVRKLLS